MLMCNLVASQENTDQRATAVASFLPDRQIPRTVAALANCPAGLSCIYVDEERSSFFFSAPYDRNMITWIMGGKETPHWLSFPWSEWKRPTYYWCLVSVVGWVIMRTPAQVDMLHILR